MTHSTEYRIIYIEKEYTYEKIIFIDPVNGRSDDGSGGSEPEYPVAFIYDSEVLDEIPEVPAWAIRYLMDDI